MRFIAAHTYLNMQGRTTAATLLRQQIAFQQQEVHADIPVRDPNQAFPSQGGKTMHELVMDLTDPEQLDEPYFRSMRQKFHWNYNTKEYEVSIHGQMYRSAAKVLRKFKQYMTEKYDEEVGEAILDTNGGPEEEERGKDTVTGITIESKDRYLNGNAQFIIIGMENMELENTNQTLADIREDDNHTMNVKSTASGLTGNMGIFVGVSYRDRCHYLHVLKLNLLRE